jgi:transposase-like protein
MLAGPMFRRKYWINVVDEFERSGLTQERFAQQRGVPVATLRSWLYRLRRERQASVSLVPVRVVASTAPVARGATAVGGELEIELKTGVRLRLSTAVDLDYVAALAQRLG